MPQFWTFWRAIRRWKWIIILGTILVPLVVGWQARKEPYVFEATCKVLPSPEAMQQQTLTATGVAIVQSKTAMGNFIQFARSRAVHEQVVKELGRDDISYGDYTSKLAIRTFENTDMMEFGWRGSSPQEARDVANTAAEEFRRYYERVNTQEATQTRELLEAQQREALRQLERAEQELRRIQAETRLLGETSLDAVFTDYQALQASVRQADVDLSAARARLASTESELGSLSATQMHPPLLEPSPRAEALKAELLEAESELQILLKDYTGNAPEVQDQRDYLARLRAELEREAPMLMGLPSETLDQRRDALRGAIADLEAQISSLVAQRQQLRRQAAEAAATIGRLPGVSVDFARLTRQITMTQDSYERLAGSLETARAAEDLARRRSRIRIFDLAVAPGSAQPRMVFQRVSIGFMAGLITSVLLVLLIDYLDVSIKTAEDVGRVVDLPVVASVPLVQLGLEPGEAGAPLSQTEAAFFEAFRTIRGKLFGTARERPLQAVALVSAGEGTGKTTLAANLAESIARAGRRVVLVDADLRFPSLHRMEGVANDVGLSSVLAGERQLPDALVGTDVPNLAFLPAGPPPADPPALLGSERMREVLEGLRAEYEWLVLDTPPAGAFVDPLVLASWLDGLLVVMAAGEAARGDERELVTSLQGARASLLGVVLNRVQLQHLPAAGYYGRYRRASGEHRVRGVGGTEPPGEA